MTYTKSLYTVIFIIIISFASIVTDCNNYSNANNVAGTIVIKPTADNMSCPNVQSSNIKLEAELSKSKYKLFEPMDVKFKYINNGKDNDSVSGLLFDNMSEQLRFYLKDSNGKIYNDKVIPHFFEGIEAPEYIVKSGDTLITVMDFNIFGIEAKYPEEHYFEDAYFPIGKYEGYAYFQKNDEIIKSNSVEFEISDLNQEDKNIMSLFQKDKLSEILANYSGNSLIEYVWRQTIRNILIKFYKKELKEKDVIKAFKDYFDKYPNSIYNIYFYISHYLDLVSAANVNAIAGSMSSLIERYPNTIISEYLSNSTARNWIEEKITNHKFYK